MSTALILAAWARRTRRHWAQARNPGTRTWWIVRKEASPVVKGLLTRPETGGGRTLDVDWIFVEDPRSWADCFLLLGIISVRTIDRWTPRLGTTAT